MALKKVKDFNSFELSHMLNGNLLELLIDTNKKEVFHVDPPVGHAKAAAEYLNKKEDKINQYNASHLVSAVVEIENNEVKQVMIGRSSLELRYDIEHTPKQLAEAKLIIERLMRISEQLGEVILPKDIKEHELVFS